MMFDATHRFVMAGHIVSVDFTKQGWRQFAAVNRRLAARYIRAFILKRELKQYIAAHEAAGVHLDTQCQEVCYDSGIYLLLRRTQGTWYITDIVLMDAAAGFVPVFTWGRVRHSGTRRKAPDTPRRTRSHVNTGTKPAAASIRTMSVIYHVPCVLRSSR